MTKPFTVSRDFLIKTNGHEPHRNRLPAGNQRAVIATGTEVPAFLAWLGTGLTYGFPNALLLFMPVAALIDFVLRGTGFGRLLYAVGDKEHAARLSGVRYWQVIVAST